ncbi:uncharacterized protein DEA37_0014044 [Paragonimus westermani]|uniref:Uncharacterized protein n=1 Tax=Paragonimus westermani TaxID=34504 RepID=A0A5J4NZA8_9TREM|nr:uncharacterized protein DEA37_0014044 [Paragonimus westermani]
MFLTQRDVRQRSKVLLHKFDIRSREVMSEIELLVNEIGRYSLEFFSKYEFYPRDSSWAAHKSVERRKSALGRLEEAATAFAGQSACLRKALDDVRRSNEKLRLERMSFIADCRKKLKIYDDYIWGNEKLKLFLELWNSKSSSNFQLTELPSAIRETAQKLVKYYDTPIESTLETALSASNLNENQENTTFSLDQSTNCDPVINVGVLEKCHVDTELENSDVAFDSEIADSSRLRMSILDTSLIPTKDTAHKGDETGSESMLLDEPTVEPSIDTTSY